MHGFPYWARRPCRGERCGGLAHRTAELVDAVRRLFGRQP